MSFLRNYLLRSSEQLSYIRHVDSSEDRIFTLNTGKCPLMTLCSVETESRCNQLRLSTGNTLWEFVICVGTLESWACRRLEYPKSPGGLMQQNWSNWSNWRIDAAKLIKLEQLGQQFKPSAGTFARHHGWVFVGPRHPWAHGPPANVKMTNRTTDRLLQRFSHTHTYEH